MRTLIISAVLLAAVCLPRSALADINLSRYPGLAIQCGPARIIVQQDGTVKTTGLPYGVYRLTTKDNEIYINEARCVPIKTLCPDDVKERSC